MTQVKHIKKVTSFLLLLVTAILLVACSKKDNVPYGSLTDNEYLSFNGVTLTEKELYKDLRRESQDILSMMIEEAIFAGYKDEAISLLDEVNPEEGTDAQIVQQKFDDNVNSKIFNTSDVEILQGLPNVNVQTNILTFVNTVYRLDASVDRAALRDDLTTIVEATGDAFATGYHKIEALRNIYLIDTQKHLYAKEQLALDLEDEDSTQYINEANVVNHYNTKIKNREDVVVFYFHLLNLNEANAALRHFGLKATSTGHYYYVPNIRYISDLEAAKQDNLNKLTQALEKANLDWLLDETWGSGETSTGITESQYTTFYNAYSVSDSEDNALEAIEVLIKFIEIYNLVNDNGIKLVDPNITNVADAEIVYINGGLPYEVEKSYDDLTELSESFAKYIYNDLSESRPYSTIRAVGGFRYLAFKLSPDHVELNYVSAEKDEDDKDKFVTIDELKALLADDETKEETLEQLKSLNVGITGETVTEAQWAQIATVIADNIALWTKEIAEARLTTGYITNTVNKLKATLDVEIYDNIVRAYYNTIGEASGKNKSGDLLLKATYTIFEVEKTLEIKVDQFYARLEANNGLEMALDLLLNEYLLNQYNQKDHGIFKEYAGEIDETKFKSDYDELITNFSNDAFAQAGYPASMGRETFLLLVFGVTDAKDAIEIGYLVPNLRQIFFENNNLSLPSLSEETKFEKLQEYTQKQYDEYRGISVNHLLIYFDFDGSGTPSDPQDYFDTLDQAKVDEIKQAIVDLHDLILHIIGTQATGGSGEAYVTLADYQNIFNNYLLSKYEETVRIDLGNFADNRFQEFKKLGLNIMFENINSNITNTSNLPYSEGTLDKVFYERAMDLHKYLDEYDSNLDADGNFDENIIKNLPFFDFAGGFNKLNDKDANLINFLDEDGIMSSFGFHFILVDSIIERRSAIYEPTQSELDDPRYQFELDGKTYNPYNEEFEYLTVNQIKYYVLGQKDDIDALVPSTVQTAINAYYSPVETLYNGNAMKQAIFYNFMKSASFNTAQKAKFDVIVEINENTFYNYMNTIPQMNNLSDYDQDMYNNWFALYGNWFEAFGLK